MFSNAIEYLNFAEETVSLSPDSTPLVQLYITMHLQTEDDILAMHIVKLAFEAN